ncbi:membrane hypothetical protein [Gammaproteobacteria bacterium]
MSNTNLAIKNSAFSFLSLGSRLAGSMITFVVIARLPGIGSIEFGQITYAIALSSIFVTFSQFGLSSLLIRDIAADKSSLVTYARSAFFLRIVLSIFSFLLMFVYLLSIEMSSQGWEVCYIIAAAFLIGSFSSDIQVLFQSHEKMHLELFGIVVENLLFIVFAFLSILFHPTVVQVSFIFLISKLVAFFLNYTVCGNLLVWVYPRIDIALCKNMLIKATPFAVTGLLASGVVQIDTVLLRELNHYDVEGSVGIYQAAVRLFLIPMLLAEIAVKVFLPMLSRIHGHDKSFLMKDLGRVNHVLLTLGMLIGCVTVFRSTDLVEFFYGDRYSAAGPVLRIFGFAMITRFGAAYGLYFTIWDKVWFRVICALLALLSVVVLDFLFIPNYGVMGAAYASLISHIFYMFLYLAGIYKSEGTIVLGWHWRRALGAGIGVLLFLYITSGLQILFMLPVYIVVVFFATFLSMLSEDRNRFLEHLNLVKP